MEIKQKAVTGTVESSDIMITIDQNSQPEISISLESSVEKQFGQQIRRLIKNTLKELGVSSAKVIAVDKGALDCTIEARMITTIYRAAGKSDYNWKGIDSWNV